MSGAPHPPAARLHDPVAHSHALGGFVAGALVGLAAAAGVAIVVGLAATAIAAEVATAGLATPLVAGVAVTVGEFAVNMYVGGKLAGLAEDAGEALGSKSMGAPSGEVSQGSTDVFTNSLPAARVTDLESCHAGMIAEGSASVFINGLPAARVGDKLTCGGVVIGGSGNVFICGPKTAALPIQSEVPQWARWAAVVVGILPALGGAARAIGPALAEIEATGFARAAQTGVKALGRAMEERAGAVRPVAVIETPPKSFPYSPKKIGQTEPGAVPNTRKLQAEITGAALVKARSADGFPDLPAKNAATFGDDVRPWNGDDHNGVIRRVIGSDRDANGGYWQSAIPKDEAEWRGGSAVLNDWNGNGGYVESPAKGLKGWIGSARAQRSSDGINVLPGHGEQIWMPPGSANPGPPMLTPWSAK